MGIQEWTWILVGLTFGAYLYIGWRSRVGTTAGFYVAGKGVGPLANGAATAADWMSAASFISMAGLISFMGFDGSVYLMGWTGGYVLLALLLAPFLRKYGKYTVPDFVAERYYSKTARLVAAVAAIFVSFVYVAGQMRGVGVAFSRFLDVPITIGVIVGMAIVAFFATLGGMKGITYTQVAQYVVLILAYLIPAIAIAFTLTGNPIPQMAIGNVLPRLDSLQEALGLGTYSSPFANLDMLNVFAITLCLMVGTAGLPHVIVRFYTVRSVRAARWSAFWALLFIGLLYTTAPAIGMFSKFYILSQFNDLGAQGFVSLSWVQNWAQTGLINTAAIMESGEISVLMNRAVLDRDIIVLATPEIAQLPAFVVGLVAAGGLAAALSTASGLLLVISSSLAHDIYGQLLRPNATDKERLAMGRYMILVAVVGAGLLGIFPLGFVAEVVAFAFGLAAASFFPVIVLGIFWKRTNKEGAISGMAVGLAFTFIMIVLMRAHVVMPGTFDSPIITDFLGIQAQGIGVIGLLLNFIITVVVTLATPPPPARVQQMVEQIRLPRVVAESEFAVGAK